MPITSSDRNTDARRPPSDKSDTSQSLASWLQLNIGTTSYEHIGNYALVEFVRNRGSHVLNRHIISISPLRGQAEAR